MTDRKLIPLTPEELAEARLVRSRRLPPGLKVGFLDLNQIISLTDDDVGLTESQRLRLKKKQEAQRLKFPEYVPASEKSEAEIIDETTALLGADFSPKDVLTVTKYFEVNPRLLHVHITGIMRAERMILNGPQEDRRERSHGKVIRWSIDYTDDSESFAIFDRSYIGWHWRRQDKEWKLFPGPAGDLPHLDFLRFRFHEVLVGVSAGLIIISKFKHEEKILSKKSRSDEEEIHLSAKDSHEQSS